MRIEDEYPRYSVEQLLDGEGRWNEPARGREKIGASDHAMHWREIQPRSHFSLSFSCLSSFSPAALMSSSFSC